MYKKELEKLLEANPECCPIFLGRFGSHLYGTDTPDSDLDIKGIFMPSKKMMYLGKTPNSIQKKDTGVKNTKNDVDIQLFSIQYFFKLAMEGETVAIDMLNTNYENILRTGGLWKTIQNNREIFYSKNMKAFVGYAQKQAARYGLKGDRLKSLRNCINVLDSYNTDKPHSLHFCWSKLPLDEHSSYYKDSPNGIRQYKICGKILQENLEIESAIIFLEDMIKKYGERSLKAERNEGVDWKALSHALRAAYELEELFTVGTITFPLNNARTILSIKKGEFDYNTVSKNLENLVDHIKDLEEFSGFPENVNKEKCEDFLYDLICMYNQEL